MFKRKSNKMARNNEVDASAINIIRSGTEIHGDIICKGDIRIDGKLIGNLKTFKIVLKAIQMVYNCFESIVNNF